MLWFVDINNLLNTFLNLFLWLVIHFYKSHVLKFIISLTSFIQILVYYSSKIKVCLLSSWSITNHKFCYIIYKFYVVKFVIILVFLQNIYIYIYILQDKKNEFLL